VGLLAGLRGYNWVGIYRLVDDGLVLDEYVGPPTAHSRISVGRGLSGEAVAENRNLVVGDLRESGRYFARSTDSRSEIVVLIRRAGAILGQIDVEGHEVGAFGGADEELLEQVAGVLAGGWE
jgi:GAF domain-containing protein